MRVLKTITFISALIVGNSSYAQLDKIKGVWISSTSDAIKIEIEDTTNEFGSSVLSNSKTNINCKAIALNDTLNLQYNYYSHSNKKSIYHADPYNFVISSFSDSIMLLKPCSNFSKQFFDNRPTIRFVRQQFTTDTSIHFANLYFHTTICLGDCPVYHLEINSNKHINLFVEQLVTINSDGVKGEDTVRQGHLSGILNDRSYDKFIKAIQTCNLKTLELAKIDGYDGSVITIIVYFNGERKYFQSMFPSTILDNLIQTLYDICEKAELKRTNDSFDFEE